MRLRLLFAGLVLAVAAMPGAAKASHDPSGAPFGEDFVVGEAFYPSGSPNPGDDIHIGIDAHSGAQGENPSGFASISLRQSFLGGPVTCLNVQGNRATIVGAAETVFATYIFVVEDNAATGAPDEFGADQVNLPTPPATCSIDVPSITTNAITSGDLVVHDAQPLPISKEQCKSGGWHDFPNFTNQGQCVMFVVRTCGQRGRFEPKPPTCPVRLPNR